MVFRSGRHFLQIPGPTNVPDRILRAMDRPTIDHRGPQFAELTAEVVAGLQAVFKSSAPVVIFPASATGGWEAALVNTLSPGDRVLMFDHGVFAANWSKVASRIGLDVDLVSGDWRRGVDPEVVEAKLVADSEHRYRAVMVVHNETSTGVTSRVAQVREAIDKARHPALLMVDAVSSLGSIDYRHDDWGVDVTIAGSQKGLMLPPGLSFNAVSQKALDVHESSGLASAYWDWDDVLDFNRKGFFPYTPATNMLFGLKEAIAMLQEEGLEAVFSRHDRLAAATRIAIESWGLEVYCADAAQYSSSVTAVPLPEGFDADTFRSIVLERFNLSLGAGLGKLKGKVFRIGHLGDLNELMLAGALCGVEMGLAAAGVPFRKGGVSAALEYLGGCGKGS